MAYKIAVFLVVFFAAEVVLLVIGQMLGVAWHATVIGVVATVPACLAARRANWRTGRG